MTDTEKMRCIAESKWLNGEEFSKYDVFELCDTIDALRDELEDVKKERDAAIGGIPRDAKNNKRFLEKGDLIGDKT